MDAVDLPPNRHHVRLSPAVVEVHIIAAERAAIEIDAACWGAAEGTHVRLHVGRHQPPPWIRDRLPSGLVWQVCAATAVTAATWNSALSRGGDA